VPGLKLNVTVAISDASSSPPEIPTRMSMVSPSVGLASLGMMISKVGGAAKATEGIKVRSKPAMIQHNSLLGSGVGIDFILRSPSSHGSQGSGYTQVLSFRIELVDLQSDFLNSIFISDPLPSSSRSARPFLIKVWSS
jgi:hypothetical protein